MTDDGGDDAQEYLKRIRRTIDRSNELLARTREKIAETDAVYRENGWTRDEVRRFLVDPDLPPELRRKLDESEEQWRQEMARMDQEQALRREAELSPEERRKRRDEGFRMLRRSYRL